MADLDTLRPEVLDLLAGIEGEYPEARTLRAELLRLATRNAELEAKATRDHDWISDLLVENKKAEDELAALKARIAEAPTAIVGRCALNSSPEYNIVTACSPLDGKRVRLVVEK